MLRRLRIENLVLIREAELELAPGLNVVTGETGAGKTILAQAVGLLLGARGRRRLRRARRVRRRTSRPSSTCRTGLLDDEELAALAELRPEDEAGLVVARRVFADGRSRAYAWGRAAPREDAGGARRAPRRDVRPVRAAPARAARRTSSTCSTPSPARSSFAAAASARGRVAELSTARRRRDEVAATRWPRAAGSTELEALVDGGRGPRARTRGGAARRARAAAQRDRARRGRRRRPPRRSHPSWRTARAPPTSPRGPRRALAPVAELAPELAEAGSRARGRGRAPARDCSGAAGASSPSLEAEPGRLEEVEERLGADRGREAAVRRRDDRRPDRACGRRPAEELEALEAGADPLAPRRRRSRAAEAALQELAGALAGPRGAAAEPFARRRRGGARGPRPRRGRAPRRARASASPARPGATRSRSSIRANAGLPLAPVADDGVGRGAVADRARPAGGRARAGRRADDRLRRDRRRHRRADRARRRRCACAGSPTRRRSITITHLPQIASVADRAFPRREGAGRSRRTRASSGSTRRSGARSSSGCSGAPSSCRTALR